MTQKRRCRPAGNGAGTNLDQDVDSRHFIRCQHCSRPLRAQLSLSRCAGPVCWRRVLTIKEAA